MFRTEFVPLRKCCFYWERIYLYKEVCTLSHTVLKRWWTELQNFHSFCLVLRGHWMTSAFVHPSQTKLTSSLFYFITFRLQYCYFNVFHGIFHWKTILGSRWGKLEIPLCVSNKFFRPLISGLHWTFNLMKILPSVLFFSRWWISCRRRNGDWWY